MGDFKKIDADLAFAKRTMEEVGRGKLDKDRILVAMVILSVKLEVSVKKLEKQKQAIAREYAEPERITKAVPVRRGNIYRLPIAGGSPFKIDKTAP